MKLRKVNNKGFTLIEVVLVLAIGGLIFLLAFLAFQQASINRRDTARRSDAARFVAELQNYKGDNSNKVPSDSTAMGTWVSSYLNSPQDPQNNSYSFTYSNTAPTATPNVSYTAGGTGIKACDGTTALGTGDAKVQMKLEKGLVCRDTLGN